MMEGTVSRIFTRRVRKIIAFILACVMLFSVAVAGLSVVSRSTIDRQALRTQDHGAALRYLSENTDYVGESIPRKIVEYIRTRQEPSALSDYYSLAGVQIAQEDFADALYSIEQCIALYNDEGVDLLVDLWLKKGCLHMMLGQLDDALAALEKVLELNEGIAEAYLVQAQIFVELDDTGRLIKSLEAYLALRPDDEEVRALLASMLIEKKDYEGMGAYVEAYVPEEPTVETEFLKGLLAIQDGDYAGAIESLNSALSIDDEYEGIRYYRGVSRLALQDYEGAIEDFSASIEHGAMVQSSHYNRGIARILADIYEPGLEDIVSASQMDEDMGIREQAEQFLAEVDKAEADANQIAHLLKAQACAEQSDYTGMCESLELYLDKAPDDIEVRVMLAQARFANGEFAAALEQYGMILQHDKTAENVFLYGLTALQLSNFALAEETITEAIILDDGIEGMYYYRGVCRLSLEKYETAEADFTRSIIRGEFIHSCHFNRGISLLMQDKTQQGLPDVKLAAEMTEDPEVKEQAEQLLRELRASGIR